MLSLENTWFCSKHYFTTAITMPTSITWRITPLIWWIICSILCDLCYWFHVSFQRASRWRSKSKKQNIWTKMKKKLKANKDKGKSNDCNHGFDISNLNRGLSCVPFVQRWLTYFRLFQYVVWGLSESVDWLVSYENKRIHDADKPALAVFLRERIPCTCLD